MSGAAKESSVVASLKDRLRQLAREKPSLDVARFQFVGLEDVRRAYGERWPQQKERISERAYDFLKRRMAPTDIIVRGAEGFVILFGALSGHEAEVEALGLSHGLNAFFLGESGGGPAPSTDVKTAAVATRDLVETMGDVDFVSGESEPAVEHTLAGIEWRFQPVWDVKREAVTMHSLYPLDKSTSERLDGYRFEATPGLPPKLDQVDEAALKFSEQATRKLLGEGKKAIIGAMAHVSSLMNLASRARLLAVLDHADHSLLRYRVLKIAGVAPGFPRMYLGEIVGALKARCPNIVMGLSWDEKDLPSIVSLPIAAIAFAVPPAMMAQPAASSELLRRLRVAVDTAHAHKKALNVEGRITPEMAMRLSAIGVDSISSSLIWPPAVAPAGVASWSADRLARPRD